MRTYKEGQKLVWIHVDDETGKRINDLVVVKNIRVYPSSAYYTIQLEANGEIAMAWHDELHEFTLE